MGTHVDETGAISNWHINKAHYLESWSDARAYDGTISIIQPMIDPMYGGKSAHDVLQTLLADPQASAYDAWLRTRRPISRATSRRVGGRRCMMAGSRARRFTPKLVVRAKTAAVASARRLLLRVGWRFRSGPILRSMTGGLRMLGWLQELPKQVTNLSWDNAALMSLATMDELKLDRDGPGEDCRSNGRKVIAPVLMIPGHPDGVVTVSSWLWPRR